MLTVVLRSKWIARVLAAMAFLAASRVSASDHLVPTEPHGDGYQDNVHLVLRDAFQPAVRVRAFAEPSFRPEFAVGVKEAAGRYAIFFLEPSRQIWDFTVLKEMKRGHIRSDSTAKDIKRLEAKLPPDPKALPVKKCEADIDAALGERLIDVWTLMLAHVHPDEHPDISGVDGANYYFSAGPKRKAPDASTWSPDPISNPGKLVAIVYTMKGYCTTKASKFLDTLNAVSGELQQDLRGQAR